MADYIRNKLTGHSTAQRFPHKLLQVAVQPILRTAHTETLRDTFQSVKPEIKNR